MTDLEVVFTRDRSSGRVHKRIVTLNGLIPYGGEQDNLDDAGEYDLIDSTEDVEPGDLCERCFGGDGA